MSSVRLLIGTRKGAFVLSADGLRHDWSVAGPFLGAGDIYHVTASPADPDRLWAAQSSSWSGQEIWRSDDGGGSWEQVGHDFAYMGDPGTHGHYDGSSQPWVFRRIWHLRPSLTDPDTIWAGAEDAALFRSSDAGGSWQELAGLRSVRSAEWTPGGGGLGLHTILLDPTSDQRLVTAISAAGVMRSDDGGTTWRAANKGLRSPYGPDEDLEVGHCVHRIARHPARPATLFMQNHSGVMRSDTTGDDWYGIGGNLPTDFGMVIDVHTHEPETVYVIPMTSDTEHVPPDGRLRVYRSRVGGHEWEPLTAGLPQEHCYVNVLREAMATDALDDCGIYFGTTGGQVYASLDSGDNWAPIVRDLPPVLSVEAQTLP